MENKKLNIHFVDDLIQKAIVYFTRDEEVAIESLQKGVFMFLYSYAIENGLDYREILRIVGFEPDEYGPTSDLVAGDCEMLAGYHKLKQIGDKKHIKYIGPEKLVNDYEYNKKELEILGNITNLLHVLTPLELTYYIYFHPLSHINILTYFKSYEVKKRLEDGKKRFLKILMKRNVVDQDAMDLMMEC